jgi:hypothetical protein
MVQNYLELIKAMFGTDALQVLLGNVLNGNKDMARNINRLDNGVAMQPTVHESWDSIDYSYNESTKEVIQVSLCANP